MQLCDKMPDKSRPPITSSRSRNYRFARATIAVLVLSALVATGAVAQNPTPDEIREKRKQVQEQQEETQDEIDALNDDIDDLLSAIETLKEARDSAQEAVDAANRNLKAAEEELRQTEERIAALEAIIAETEQSLQLSVVSAYVSHQGPNSEQTALSEDPWQHAHNTKLRDFANRSTEDVLDELRGQRAELAVLREAALRKVSEVEALRNEVLERKYDFDRALTREYEALEDLDLRQFSLMSKLQNLKDLDDDLRKQLEAELERIERAKREEEERRRRQARAAALPANANVPLTNVRGIVIHTDMAAQLEALLAEMEERGFVLGGWGYRSHERQIELRKHHCGTSPFAINDMSASRCRPPTARPGKSRHEVGKAVDFTYKGRGVTSRSSAVYKALAEVAPKHGFHNLPSEPWHWSDNGH